MIFTPLHIYTIEDYKPHLRFVIFKGIAHEIYIRTLKGADINLRWSKTPKIQFRKKNIKKQSYNKVGYGFLGFPFLML